MEDPYLHREKEYLKINAQLDNRFKEIKSSESWDQTKPRPNVFGHGPKVHVQSNVKRITQNTKRKVSEVRATGTTTTTRNSEKVQNSKQNENCESSGLTKTNNKPPKLIDTQYIANCNNMCSEKSVKQSKDIDDLTISNQSTNNNVSVSLSNEVGIKKNISSEGLIKFLKSKVTILQQELELNQQENVKNQQAYENCIEQHKKDVVQMEHMITENEALKKQVDKLKDKNDTYESAIEEKDTDLIKLNRNLEELKKEIKEVNRSHNSLEKRLLKSQDDLEHTKKNLNNSVECERQQRTINNQQRNFFEDQIKALSKQRTGLISAYKKQLLLLDNLKRQNVCLEQSKLIQMAEKDFLKILDWNN